MKQARSEVQAMEERDETKVTEEETTAGQTAGGRDGAAASAAADPGGGDEDLAAPDETEAGGDEEDEELEDPAADRRFAYTVVGEDEPGEEEDDWEETPEEREETLRMLEEARLQYESITEDEYSEEYKKLAGIIPVAAPEVDDEGIPMGRCEDCGKEVPETKLYDNGSYLVCKDCI